MSIINDIIPLHRINKTDTNLSQLPRAAPQHAPQMHLPQNARTKHLYLLDEQQYNSIWERIFIYPMLYTDIYWICLFYDTVYFFEYVVYFFTIIFVF